MFPRKSFASSPQNQAAGMSDKPKPRVRPPMTVATLRRWIGRLDMALVVVVLVLAFFLASFAVHNSDFWMHLATGRLLAQGGYTFGVDPFSYTSYKVFWVNHAWLFDWLLYRGYQALGGPALVVVKALLITLLAGVLLLIRQPGSAPSAQGDDKKVWSQSWWLPAVGTALALLALSPRLVFQPTIISFLFLGITVWLLADGPWTKEQFIRRVVCLAVLFAVWVNVDNWFLLGPLTVALFLLGNLLEHVVRGASASAAQVDTSLSVDACGPRKQDTRREMGQMALMLLIGLTACLLNPHLLQAFTLPAEISPAVPHNVLCRDPLFATFFRSPWDSQYFSSEVAVNVAGLTYHVLFVLSLASLLVNYSGWRGWRILVWLVFAAFSAYRAPTVPFFAIVAGPITVLNFQDVIRRRFGTLAEMGTSCISATNPLTPAPLPRSGGEGMKNVPISAAWKRWSLLGRAATLLAGLILLAAAWPGWLHMGAAGQQRNRHVTWEVVSDPSFHQVAKTIAEWQLPSEARGLHLSPEVVSFFAWECPAEKGYFDYRFQLFPEQAAEIVQLRRSFAGDDRDFHVDDWRRVFRKNGISHLLVTLPDRPRPTPIFQQMLSASREWPLLYLDGRTLVFGWNDPEAPSYPLSPAAGERGRGEGVAASQPLSPAAGERGRGEGAASADKFAALRYDSNRGAFAQAANRPPAQGPSRLPHVRSWWEKYALAPLPHPLAADEAEIHMQYFGILGINAQRSQIWARRVGLVGQAGAGSDAVATCVQTAFRLGLLVGADSDPKLPAAQRVIRSALNPDFGPPGELILAVRAARRAVAANPDDAASYVALAKAYRALWESQESPWHMRQANAPFQLLLLRRTQIIAAAQQALTLET